MKWGPTHIENMNQKSCITEDLEHGNDRMSSLCFLLILIMFAIVIT